jgi:hypothetical protein
MGLFNLNGSFWFLLLVSATTCQLTIHRPTTQDDYFGLVWGQNHTLVGYINSKTDPAHTSLIDRLFDRLSKDRLLADWEFNLIVVDVAEIEMLYDHYSMTGLPNFYYFVRKQLIKCSDFATIFTQALTAKSPDRLVDFAEKWIHDRLNSIVVELQSLTDFETKVAAKKILGIYFGKKDAKFRLFQRWAARYIHFSFFFTSSDDLKNAVFASRHLSAPNSDAPFLAVVRDTELITEFDPQPIVATARVGTEQELSQFFEFERFPKLMDPSMGSNITQMLFYNNEKLVVMITSPSTPKEDIAIYHQALAELPKRMIYSQVDLNSQHIAAFMQLFMLAKVNMAPGRIYAVNVLPNRQVEVRDMQEGLTVRNIVGFIAGVIQQHAEFFGVPRHDSRASESTEAQTNQSNQSYETDL